MEFLYGCKSHQVCVVLFSNLFYMIIKRVKMMYVYTFKLCKWLFLPVLFRRCSRRRRRLSIQLFIHSFDLFSNANHFQIGFCYCISYRKAGGNAQSYLIYWTQIKSVCLQTLLEWEKHRQIHIRCYHCFERNYGLFACLCQISELPLQHTHTEADANGEIDLLQIW